MRSANKPTISWATAMTITRRVFLLLFVAVVNSAILYAQRSSSDEIRANVLLSASNYAAYPDSSLPALTPAPKGYIPFYINHYGRHGSRWLIRETHYGIPVEQLEIAQRNGKLTEKGKKVLADLKQLKKMSQDRLGELTDVGADQHKRIAARMFRNFPEIFGGDTPIDAKSTIVIRCILSMENELQQLIALNPKLKIKHDASMADMYYMNYNDTSVNSIRKSASATLQEFQSKNIHPQRLTRELISDTLFINDSIDAASLMNKLFDVAGNMQSHYPIESEYTPNTNISFINLFNQKEIYELWQNSNAFWYVYYGPSPLTMGRMPYIEKNLLQNMIQSADIAITDANKNSNGRPSPSATLRFGHESCLMPLACLMELNDAGVQEKNLDNLANVWRNYDIYPMACNIQMIFYKKRGTDDILVKVLLNEKEARLPIESDMKPYYHWKEVKAYYENKLNQ